MNQQHGTVRGFSIIEVMVAVTILVVGVLGVARILPFEIQISRSAENRTVAAHRAQSIIEEMLNTAYGSLNEGSFVSVATPESPDDIFAQNATVSCIDEDLVTISCAGDIGLKQVSVTITWQNKPNGPTEDYTLVTLTSNH